MGGLIRNQSASSTSLQPGEKKTRPRKKKGKQGRLKRPQKCTGPEAPHFGVEKKEDQRPPQRWAPSSLKEKGGGSQQRPRASVSHEKEGSPGARPLAQSKLVNRLHPAPWGKVIHEGRDEGPGVR